MDESEEHLKVAIVGAGGVGGYFGARWAEAGLDVTLLARGAHLEAINTKGLVLHSPLGDARVDVPAVGSAAEVGEVDVVVVATKAWQLASPRGRRGATGRSGHRRVRATERGGGGRRPVHVRVSLACLGRYLPPSSASSRDLASSVTRASTHTSRSGSGPGGGIGSDRVRCRGAGQGARAHGRDRRRHRCGAMAQVPLLCPAQWPRLDHTKHRSVCFGASPNRGPCSRGP